MKKTPLLLLALLLCAIRAEAVFEFAEGGERDSKHSKCSGRRNVTAENSNQARIDAGKRQSAPIVANRLPVIDDESPQNAPVTASRLPVIDEDFSRDSQNEIASTFGTAIEDEESDDIFDAAVATRIKAEAQHMLARIIADQEIFFGEDQAHINLLSPEAFVDKAEELRQIHDLWERRSSSYCDLLMNAFATRKITEVETEQSIGVLIASCHELSQAAKKTLEKLEEDYLFSDTRSTVSKNSEDVDRSSFVTPREAELEGSFFSDISFLRVSQRESVRRGISKMIPSTRTSRDFFETRSAPRTSSVFDDHALFLPGVVKAPSAAWEDLCRQERANENAIKRVEARILEQREKLETARADVIAKVQSLKDVTVLNSESIVRRTKRSTEARALYKAASLELKKLYEDLLALQIKKRLLFWEKELSDEVPSASSGAAAGEKITTHAYDPFWPEGKRWSDALEGARQEFDRLLRENKATKAKIKAERVIMNREMQELGKKQKAASAACREGTRIQVALGFYHNRSTQISTTADILLLGNRITDNERGLNLASAEERKLISDEWRFSYDEDFTPEERLLYEDAPTKRVAWHYLLREEALDQLARFIKSKKAGLTAFWADCTSGKLIISHDEEALNAYVRRTHHDFVRVLVDRLKATRTTLPAFEKKEAGYHELASFVAAAREWPPLLCPSEEAARVERVKDEEAVYDKWLSGKPLDGIKKLADISVDYEEAVEMAKGIQICLSQKDLRWTEEQKANAQRTLDFLEECGRKKEASENELITILNHCCEFLDYKSRREIAFLKTLQVDAFRGWLFEIKQSLDHFEPEIAERIKRLLE